MGGSSGGGGGSGRVDYPDYMKVVHGDWLDNDADDKIGASLSVTALISVALGAEGNPWTSSAAYIPATPLADAWTAVCAFNTVADALDHESDWLSAIAAAMADYDDNVVDETHITDDINAYAQVLHDDLDYVQMPKLKAGYRDVNAVMSSAFPIAEGVLFGMHQKDVAKYATDLRLKNHFIRSEWIAKSAETMLKNLMERVRFEEAVARISVEAKRIHIVASKEQTDQGYAFDESEARWDLETYQYGANVLAAIGGGTSTPGKNQPSKLQSALGGALSGAAAGSTFGAPGMIGGAILGAGAALLG